MKNAKHILLVNSVSADGDELRQLLEAHRHQVKVVSSGLAAMDVLAEDSFDLVVTAITIGEIDCWRLTRFIRSGCARGVEPLPIIIVTREWCGRITEITARDFGITHLLRFEDRHLLPEAVENCFLLVPKGLGKRRVLVAVDDRDNARLVEKVLQTRFDVQLVNDGQAAFDVWQEQRHNLVVLDTLLPKQSGGVILDKIMAIDSKQPVVMISAQGSIADAKKLMLQGAADIIVKPFKTDDLRKVCELATLREDYLVSNAQMLERMASLQQLRKQLENIVESMPSILIGVDCDGIINLWNKQAESSSGMPESLAVGKPLEEAWPGFFEMEEVSGALHHGEVRKLTKVMRQQGEKTCYCNITVYPLYETSVVGAVIRIDDVTKQVLLEERIVHSEKMVSMGQLAAGMAHEINNPLAGVLQNIQVVRQRLFDHSTANKNAADAVGIDSDIMAEYLDRRDIRNILNRVMDSGKRASQLIENMLSFSRLDNCSMVLTDLADLIDKSIELAAGSYSLQRKFDFRLIELKREFDQHLPLVECNPVQMQQVIFNLLMNGADAMEERLQSHRIEPDSDEYRPLFVLRTKYVDQQCRIEIEDNGSGIDEITQKRLFEPFYTTKKVGDGTGLGLSICYFIVTETHHGRLSVESTPNVGSRFVIELPQVRPLSA